MRHRPGRPAGPGGRAGPRQRRPRPARRLLHRLAGDDERALHRLRHPLRVRHLPPDLRRRPAGRAARHLAGARLARGSSRTPRPRSHRRLRRPHRDTTPTTTASQRTRWVPGWNVLASPTTTWSRATRTAGSTRCGCGARGRHQRVRPADLQLRRLRRGRPRADLRGEHLQGALPRGLHPAGQGAAAAAAVLLRRRARSATSSTASCRADFDLHQAARADHLPAQRHPPGDRASPS